MFDLSTLWCKLITLSKYESRAHSEFLTIPIEINENEFFVIPYDSEKYSFTKKVHRVFCFGVDSQRVLVASPRMIINSFTPDIVAEYESEFENRHCLNEIEKIMLGSMNVDRVKIKNYFLHILSFKDFVFAVEESGGKKFYCSLCNDWVSSRVENNYLCIHFILNHLTIVYSILTKNVFIAPNSHLVDLNLVNSGTDTNPVFNIVIPECEKCRKQLRVVNYNDDYSKITFSCDYCNSRNYCFNYDDVSRRYNCNICQKSYKNFCTLKRHLYCKHSLKYQNSTKPKQASIDNLVDEKPPKIVCLKCDQEFDNVDDCEQHNRAVHGKQRNWYCSDCKKKFKNRKNFILHVAICQEKAKQKSENHKENVIVTEHCGNMKKMLENKHDYNELKYAEVQQMPDTKNKDQQQKAGDCFCYTCKVKFKSNYELKRHLLSVHRRKYKFMCIHCSFKKFRDKFDLKRHLKQVHKMSDLPLTTDFLLNYINDEALVEDLEADSAFVPPPVHSVTLNNLVSSTTKSLPEENNTTKMEIKRAIFRNSERGYYWDRKKYS